MVQIVDVHCANCGRKFTTIPSVIEHAAEIHCPVCGMVMDISPAQPVSTLSRNGKTSAA